MIKVNKSECKYEFINDKTGRICHGYIYEIIWSFNDALTGEEKTMTFTLPTTMAKQEIVDWVVTQTGENPFTSIQPSWCY